MTYVRIIAGALLLSISTGGIIYILSSFVHGIK